MNLHEVIQNLIVGITEHAHCTQDAAKIHLAEVLQSDTVNIAIQLALMVKVCQRPPD